MSVARLTTFLLLATVPLACSVGPLPSERDGAIDTGEAIRGPGWDTWGEANAVDLGHPASGGNADVAGIATAEVGRDGAETAARGEVGRMTGGTTGGGTGGTTGTAGGGSGGTSGGGTGGTTGAADAGRGGSTGGTTGTVEGGSGGTSGGGTGGTTGTAGGGSGGTSGGGTGGTTGTAGGESGGTSGGGTGGTTGSGSGGATGNKDSGAGEMPDDAADANGGDDGGTGDTGDGGTGDTVDACQDESPATDSQPPPTWHVLTIPDLPADAWPVGIWAGAPNDVYVSAYITTDIPTGYVWHWDGSSWSVVLSLPGHQTGEVYGTSSTDVFVASYRCADGWVADCGADRGGRIFRSTDGGGSFVEQALPSEVGTNWIAHISGTPGNVHAAVGGSTIIRFDGTAWDSYYPHNATQGLTVFAPNEGYYVACWGWGRWDGTAWSYHDQGWDFCDVNHLWGMRDNSGVLHLCAAGNNNWSNGVRVWCFDEAKQSFGGKYGYVCSDGDAPYTGSATGIWGAAGDDIYVIGEIKDPPRSGRAVLGEGRVYHYDGTACSRVTAVPDIITPTAISGSAADNVWVTMSDGRLLRYGP